MTGVWSGNQASCWRLGLTPTPNTILFDTFSVHIKAFEQNRPLHYSVVPPPLSNTAHHTIQFRLKSTELIYASNLILVNMYISGFQRKRHLASRGWTNPVCPPQTLADEEGVVPLLICGQSLCESQWWDPDIWPGGGPTFTELFAAWNQL